MSFWAFTRWWRVVSLDDGQLWCETSDEDEARDAVKKCPFPCELQRHQTRTDDRWVKVP